MRPFFNLKPISNRKMGQGLFIDSVPLSDILELSTSPVYVTSLNAIVERINIYKSCLKNYFINHYIFYAMKANFAETVLQHIKETGVGVDIVSIGEWRAARHAGFLPQNICFAGAGKKEEEWAETIEGGIGFINIEHLSELYDILCYLSLNKVRLSTVPILSLRLNPCVEVKTHPHLKTGALDSKFGILFEHFVKWMNSIQQEFSSKQEFANWISPLKGIHVHVGSQLMENKIFSLIIDKVLECAHFMFENNMQPSYLDLGGGLGVPFEGVDPYGDDIKKHVEFFSSILLKKIKKHEILQAKWGKKCENLVVSFEPGRSIVASSTVFITKVLYTKHNSAKHHFCYVDGAMNDFPRPSLYNAKHHCEVIDLQEGDLSEKKFHWKIVGPVCESGDCLSSDALLPELKKNDVIAFFEAGAYCRSMANNYNLRKLPSEIFIKDGKIIKVIKNELPPIQ